LGIQTIANIEPRSYTQLGIEVEETSCSGKLGESPYWFPDRETHGQTLHFYSRSGHKKAILLWVQKMGLG
jgi:hypothetical protein